MEEAGTWTSRSCRLTKFHSVVSRFEYLSAALGRRKKRVPAVTRRVRPRLERRSSDGCGKP